MWWRELHRKFHNTIYVTKFTNLDWPAVRQVQTWSTKSTGLKGLKFMGLKLACYQRKEQPFLTLNCIIVHACHCLFVCFCYKDDPRVLTSFEEFCCFSYMLLPLMSRSSDRTVSCASLKTACFVLLGDSIKVFQAKAGIYTDKPFKPVYTNLSDPETRLLTSTLCNTVSSRFFCFDIDCCCFWTLLVLNCLQPSYGIRRWGGNSSAFSSQPLGRHIDQFFPNY